MSTDDDTQASPIDDGAFVANADQQETETEPEAEYSGPLYLTKLTINNFKICQFVEIDAESGEPIIIAGDNEQGKSTVMDSVKSLFFGKDACPGEPIKRGKSKAQVKGYLSDGQAIQYIVTRNFTKTGGTTLSVERADGEAIESPQKFLTSLVGDVKKADDSIAFDPTILIGMPTAKQDELLRRVCNLDFTDIDAEHKAVYARRTAKNKEAERAQGDAERMPFVKGLPDKEVPFADALAELERREKTQKENDETIRKRDQHVSDINLERERLGQIAEATAQIEQQISELQNRLRMKDIEREQVTRTITDGEAAIAELSRLVDALVDPEVGEAKRNIAELEEKNRQIRANALRREALDKAKKLAEESDSMTDKLKELEAAKANRLEDAQFPIVGLGFDDIGPTFDGFPLDQVNTAKLILIGAAIAEKLRPRLRLLLVRRGTELGPAARKVLFDLCQEKRLGCWLEEVNLTGEGATILMEAGEARRM